MRDVQAIWRISEFCGFWTWQGCAGWEPPRLCCARNCLFGQPLQPETNEADRAFIEAYGSHYPGFECPRGEWVRLHDPKGFEEMAFCNMAFEEATRPYLLHQPFDSTRYAIDGYVLEITVGDDEARVPLAPEDVVRAFQSAIRRETALAGVNIGVEAVHSAPELTITLRLPRSLAVKDQVHALARAGVAVLKKYYPSSLEPWFFTFEELVRSGWFARQDGEHSWEVFRPNGAPITYIGGWDLRGRRLKSPRHALKAFHDLRVLEACRRNLPVPEKVRQKVKG